MTYDFGCAYNFPKVMEDVRSYRYPGMVVIMQDISENPVYEALPDEEIVALAQGGSKEASAYITEKYYPFVKNKSRGYFLIGADQDDICQEGLIGLYEAVRDFNAKKQVSFKTFAEVCVTRQIITAIKSATRQKHIPLNTYLSLNKPAGADEGDKTFIDMLTSGIEENPEDLFISVEKLREINTEIDSILSEFELRVLKYYLYGVSYQDIASLLKKEEKAIDNAIQRIRKKLNKTLFR